MTTAALPRPLRSWAEFARIGFVNILAFRLRYYTGVATYLINVAVYFFIWRALYRADPEFAAGFNFREMATYVAVGWIIRSVYFNNIDQNMAQDIQNGSIVTALLKPARVQTIYIGQALGEAAFRLLLLTAPTALAVSLLFPVQGPADALHFLAFLLSLAGSVLLTAGLNFIVGTFSIVMTTILGLLRAKFYVQELLSGLLVPMTMFPEPLRELLGWLPFQHIAYTPLRIYLGKLQGQELVRSLAIEWLWVTVLMVGGAVFWNWMSRRLTVHGG